MKVSEILTQKGRKPFASFEIVPPLKGSDISKLYASIEPLMEFEPPFMNFTSHRDEVEYRKNENGTFTQVTVTKRPSTLAIVSAVSRRFPQIEVVPHVICGGQTADQNESLLLDLHFLGFHNIMALRGDAPKGEKYFAPTPGGHAHSSELVAQIQKMNAGNYLDPNIKNAVSTDFCVGVGGYPEKHIEAPNMEADIQNLKRKVDEGADYVITQMFFDNRKYFSFVEKCRAAGIKVPIIPGIKPISTRKQIELLPHAFALDLPVELMAELKKCKDDTAVYECGIAWCIAQCKELLAGCGNVIAGAPAIHFYTMGKAENIKRVIKAVF